jgi:hypothetical protein
VPETIDSHRDASVLRALAPLAALADRRDLAVVVVCHLTKDETRRLITRVSGSGAFVNAARSVLVFARDPDDADGEQGHERVILHAASNWGRYAATLAVRIESRLVDTEDGERADVGYLVVTGETTVSVEDVQNATREERSDDDYAEAIAAALAGGARSSRDVKTQVADELKCSPKTVERHAMRMLERGELTVEQGGFPRRTTWGLVIEDSARRGGPY